MAEKTYYLDKRTLKSKNTNTRLNNVLNLKEHITNIVQDQIDDSNLTITYPTNITFASTAPEVKMVTKTISSANLLALNATPITVISAPGAGYGIEIISASWKFDAGATPYTVVGVTAIKLGNQLSLPTGAITSASDGTFKFVDNVAVIATPSITVNGAITFSAAGADPAAGNGSGVLNVMYRVIPAI